MPNCPCPFAALVFVVTSALVAACGGAGRPAPPAAGSGDAAFTELSRDILQDHFRRNPSAATDLGIHTYDDQIEDVSQAAIAAESQAMKRFRHQLDAVDPATLTLEKQLDREQLVRAMDSGVLGLDVIKRWARDPDAYSGGITNAAYVIMKRSFAPAGDRLKSLIAREKRMPASLAEARKNLENPPRVYTDIAIEQIDGNISFFKNDVPAAFKDVSDRALLAEFTKANDEVMAALTDYKTFLRRDLLSRSTGTFAIGADTYAKALAANEMIDLPLDRLLSIAEADRRKNEEAFQATAKQIDPAKSPDAVLASLQADHPQPGALLSSTQETLDSLRQFIIDHRIVTIPAVRPRARQGDAAVHALDDVGVDGHAGTVRGGQARRVLQHDAARPAMERRRSGGLHAPVVLRLDQQCVGTRGVSGPLSPVSLCHAFPDRRQEGVWRHDQHRRLGALL